jgi:glyoxylase-like metal-dependent hydrolase (beta-lactamase superfamily II)
MVNPTRRRDFLGQMLTGAAGLSLSCIGASGLLARQARSPVAAAKLVDSFYQISGAGRNILALTTGDGILLVNGGLAERPAEVRQVIANQSSPKSIQAVFNTDWHPENTGANEMLRSAGAKIIAHENTKLWLGTDIFVEWENRTYKPVPQSALPNQTFYTAGKMTFGNEEIQYGHLGQAHTDGDIYVFFPRTNILATGDVFNVGAYPIPDYCTNGWLGGLVNATKTLLGLADAKSLVVPGSGPVQTRADLESQLEMCSTLKNKIAEMMKQGKGADEISAAGPTKEFDQKWGDPKTFLSVVYRGMWSHVRELGGIV